MYRFLVTGTDTDVGKTRVTAALAGALRAAGRSATVVKLVQTGIDASAPGDAQRSGTLAGVPFLECARFLKVADPWSAALAEGVPPVRAADLAHILERFEGAVVAEGAGGLAVPLNRTEHFGTVAQLARLHVVLAVGLRLGCMNHALLTVALCEQLRLPLAGAVLVERWETCEASYITDVKRTMQGKVRVLGILPFEADETLSVERGAQLFESLV